MWDDVAYRHIRGHITYTHDIEICMDKHGQTKPHLQDGGDEDGSFQ